MTTDNRSNEQAPERYGREVEDPQLEEVRGWYIDGRRTHNPFASDADLIERFDRWLADYTASVERAAAARALEEAADEIFAQHDEITAMQREAFHRGADAVYSALRARAAEIRERKSDGES